MFKHGIFMMLVTHAGSVINMAFHMVLGRMLSQTQYGVLASMLGLTLLLVVPINSLCVLLAHFVARLHQENRQGEIMHLAIQWCRKLVFVAIPFLVLVFFLRAPVAGFFHLESAWPVLTTALILAGSLFVPVFQGGLQGLQAFGWLAASQQVWSIIRLALGVLLIWRLGDSAVWGLAGHAAGVVGSILIGWWGLWWLTRSVPHVPAQVFGTDRYFLLSLLTLAAFGVLMNADIVLAKHYFSPERAGFFAWAATISRTAVFMPQPLASALFPKVVAKPGEAGASHTGALWRALLLAILLLGVTVAAVCLWPGLAVWVLFGAREASPELLNLVRGMTLAMAPLGLVMMLVHFEIAQHRFAILWPLAVCAAIYLGGVSLWHSALSSIPIWLGIASLLAVVASCTLTARQWRLARS